MQYQLISTVPGVTVCLTQNPLNAKIEISEEAKQLLALLIWTEHLVDNYFLTAGCYLTPKSGRQVDGVYIPNKPEPDKAASWLESGAEIWSRDWHGETEGNDTANNVSRIDRIIQDPIVRCYFASLDMDHCGDCTCVAASCERCLMEEMLGINTIPNDKHVNYRLATMYFEEFATPEVKAAKAKLHAKFGFKYPRSAFIPDDGTKKRWAKEESLASVAYAEHKRLYREQEAFDNGPKYGSSNTRVRRFPTGDLTPKLNTAV